MITKHWNHILQSSFLCPANVGIQTNFWLDKWAGPNHELVGQRLQHREIMELNDNGYLDHHFSWQIKKMMVILFCQQPLLEALNKKDNKVQHFLDFISIASWSMAVLNFGQDKAACILCFLVFKTTIYCIWKAQNILYHQQTVWHPEHMVVAICKEVATWIKNANLTKEILSQAILSSTALDAFLLSFFRIQ
eukprot:Gb_19966 [translate_table: standard]